MNGNKVTTSFYLIREQVLLILVVYAPYCSPTFWHLFFQQTIRVSKGHLQLQERLKLLGAIWVSRALHWQCCQS